MPSSRRSSPVPGQIVRIAPGLFLAQPEGGPRRGSSIQLYWQAPECFPRQPGWPARVPTSRGALVPVVDVGRRIARLARRMNTGSEDPDQVANDLLLAVVELARKKADTWQDALRSATTLGMFKVAVDFMER